MKTKGAGKAEEVLVLAMTLAPVTVHLSLLRRLGRPPMRAALGQGVPEIGVEEVCSRLVSFPVVVVVPSMQRRAVDATRAKHPQFVKPRFGVCH
jgi:hypothetical protein